MNSAYTVNKHEKSILYTLRHLPAARYTEIMKPTGLESDSFKFHIRKLVRSGLIEKHNTIYSLTTIGKEYANNIDSLVGAPQKQPKTSLLLLVTKEDELGEMSYLVQKRLRHPFYGYWGLLSGPAQWGRDFEDTAAQELRKQTGLVAQFSTKSFVRSRDYIQGTNSLLEDKLFIVLQATQPNGELLQEWRWGENTWMSLEKIEQLSKVFPQTKEVISKENVSYKTIKHYYSTASY